MKGNESSPQKVKKLIRLFALFNRVSSKMQSILIIGLAPDGTIGPVQIREELNLLKSEFNILVS